MSATSLSRTPARRSGVLAQQVKPDDPALVLLDPKSGKYFTLDAVGTQIWKLCDGAHTVSRIAELLAEEYEESLEVIEGDVVDLLRELLDEDLVVAAP
jgi:hypothetical protein